MKRRMVSGVWILLALGMIVLGIYRNEAAAVWQKAVNICLECIGVG